MFDMPSAEGLSPTVSKDSTDKLRAFAEAVRHWTRSINLISESSVDEIWQRHILDALQILEFAPSDARTWCDMGSGAGFPGLVAAIVNLEKNPQCSHVLIESDRRKAAFLTLQSKAFGLRCTVTCDRIEKVVPVRADVVTARALAPMPLLLSYAHRHAGAGATCVFPKGRGVEAEVDASRRDFIFDVDFHRSKTDPQGSILVIRNLAPRGKGT